MQRNWKPARRAACGITRCPPSSICDISPNRILSANAGTGKMAGRCNTTASSRVKAALVTGFGATAFTGPLRAASVIANSIKETRSSKAIQDIHCSPVPKRPPTPRRNGSSICASAPPLRPSTTPIRGTTTRTPNCSATCASCSQPSASCPRKSDEGGESSVRISSPREP